MTQAASTMYRSRVASKGRAGRRAEIRPPAGTASSSSTQGWSTCRSGAPTRPTRYRLTRSPLWFLAGVGRKS